MRTPYFTKKNPFGDVELFFHSGETGILVTRYETQKEASRAEDLANDAFHRGRLMELRAAKHRGNLENQRLAELLAEFDR